MGGGLNAISGAKFYRLFLGITAHFAFFLGRAASALSRRAYALVCALRRAMRGFIPSRLWRSVQRAAARCPYYPSRKVHSGVWRFLEAYAA